MENSTFSGNEQPKEPTIGTPAPTPNANTPPVSLDRITEATKVLKRLMRSWIMLALAISCTVTTIFTVVDSIPKLKGLLIVINFVKLLLAVVACIGVWKIFFAGRSQTNDSGGFKLVHGVLSTRYFVIILILILVYIFIFLAFGVISEISGGLDSMLAEDGELSLTVNNILIIALVVATLAIVMIILFFKAVLGTLNSASKLLDQRIVAKNNYYLAAVILILIGLFKLISAILTGAISSIFGELMGQISGEVSALSSISKLFPIGSEDAQNWSGIVVNVCDMLNYILGGVLIILYAVKVKKYEMPGMIGGTL